MSVSQIAYQTIPKSDGQTDWVTQSGNTNDIIAVIIEADRDEATTSQTKTFAKQLRKQSPNDYEFLRELWQFVRSEIVYKVDPPGKQFIKSPARTWSDRYGDCKSMTLFITSVLRNLGIDYKIRFTSYKLLGKFTHVYPVAIVNNEEIILDAVHYAFNEEIRYKKKKDVMTEIARLSGVDNSFATYAKRIKRYIPMASATDGEVYLHIMRRQLQLKAIRASNKQKIALQKGMDIIDAALVRGIHNAGSRIITGHLPNEVQFVGNILNNAASRGRAAMSFQPSTIGNPYEPTPQQINACQLQVAQTIDYVDWQGNPCTPSGEPLQNGIYLGDASCRPVLNQDISDAFDDCAMGKFYENLLNDHFEDAGPALMYNFLTDENDYPNVKDIGLNKSYKEIEYVGSIQRMSGLSLSNLNSIVRNGVIWGSGGKDPEIVLEGLNNMNTPDYDAIGLAPGVLEAIVAIGIAVISAVVAVVEITSNAKQQDPLDAEMDDFYNRYNKSEEWLKDNFAYKKTDWNVLTSNDGDGNNGGGNNGGGNNNSSNLILPGLLLAGAYFYNKKR